MGGGRKIRKTRVKFKAFIDVLVNVLGEGLIDPLVADFGVKRLSVLRIARYDQVPDPKGGLAIKWIWVYVVLASLMTRNLLAELAVVRASGTYGTSGGW